MPTEPPLWPLGDLNVSVAETRPEADAGIARGPTEAKTEELAG